MFDRKSESITFLEAVIYNLTPALLKIPPYWDKLPTFMKFKVSGNEESVPEET